MIDLSKLADYPLWVKLVASVWLLLTILLALIILFKKPEQKSQTQLVSSPTKQSAKLTQPEKELDILKLLSVQTEAVSPGQIAQWLPIPMDKDVVEYYLNQLQERGLIQLSSLFIRGAHHPNGPIWVITKKGRTYLTETKLTAQPIIRVDD